MFIHQLVDYFAGGLYHQLILNNIDYIEMATTGNALDFGDLNNGIPARWLWLLESPVEAFCGGMIFQSNCNIQMEFRCNNCIKRRCIEFWRLNCQIPRWCM